MMSVHVPQNQQQRKGDKQKNDEKFSIFFLEGNDKKMNVAMSFEA